MIIVLIFLHLFFISAHDKSHQESRSCGWIVSTQQLRKRPQHTALGELQCNLARMLRAKIRDNLRTARRVNTWVQKVRIHSYLDVTAHFVNIQQKRRQSVRLGLQYFRIILV